MVIKVQLLILTRAATCWPTSVVGVGLCRPLCRFRTVQGHYLFIIVLLNTLNNNNADLGHHLVTDWWYPRQYKVQLQLGVLPAVTQADIGSTRGICRLSFQTDSCAMCFDSELLTSMNFQHICHPTVKASPSSLDASTHAQGSKSNF
jgi:hypothetical protein